jgi:hypothetical protein
MNRHNQQQQQQQQQQQSAPAGIHLPHNGTSTSSAGRGVLAAVAGTPQHGALEAPSHQNGSLHAVGAGGALGVLNLAQGVQTQAQYHCWS